MNDLSTRYASMRRREVLTRVRDLLLSDYHNTMLAAGDGMRTFMIFEVFKIDFNVCKIFKIFFD